MYKLDLSLFLNKYHLQLKFETINYLLLIYMISSSFSFIEIESSANDQEKEELYRMFDWISLLLAIS